MTGYDMPCRSPRPWPHERPSRLASPRLPSLRPLAFILPLALAGCSGNVDDALDRFGAKREVNYKSSRSLPPLEVPPDLSTASLNDPMAIPAARAEGGTTYSAYANASQSVSAAGINGVLPSFTQVQVERNGDKRWLTVNAPPSKVWPKVREFWLEQGFIIQMEDPSIGIMETDWAVQRNDLRSGWLSRLGASLSTALYGAATRDKFRTRLERSADRSATEIFISHRGAEEVVANSNPRTYREGEEAKVWQPRPSDPELEAEMVNRMMVFFGVNEEEANKLIAQGPSQPDRAHMVRESNGASVLSLDEDFSRAWRRTGLALDRVGFTVGDRDRARGLYYVRYIDPYQDVGTKKDGFFSKLAFWSDKEETPHASEYLISLIGDDSTTQVVILNKQGERDKSETADRILSLLHEQLR